MGQCDFGTLANRRERGFLKGSSRGRVSWLRAGRQTASVIATGGDDKSIRLWNTDVWSGVRSPGTGAEICSCTGVQ